MTEKSFTEAYRDPDSEFHDGFGRLLPVYDEQPGWAFIRQTTGAIVRLTDPTRVRYTGDDTYALTL